MPGKLGILAGGGDLPRRIVEACRRNDRPFFVLALEGAAEAETVVDTPHAWVRLGAAATGLRLLRANGVEELVLAGGVRRPSLLSLRPDWRAAKLFARLGTAALGDDGLLRAVIRELEAEGFRVVGVEDVVGAVLAPDGPVGRLGLPDGTAEEDTAHGFRIARALGAVDVGQAVVVQGGVVLGVEAAEGTDALLARCGALRREGPGGVLVKALKPGQENRADRPTIGSRTVVGAHAAGLRGIAVEAGGALIVDRVAVAREADRTGLFVVGVKAP